MPVVTKPRRSKLMKMCNWSGAGRFEGATGSGTMDDYYSSENPNLHHHWTGTITMVKGKK